MDDDYPEQKLGTEVKTLSLSNQDGCAAIRTPHLTQSHLNGLPIRVLFAILVLVPAHEATYTKPLCSSELSKVDLLRHVRAEGIHGSL